MKICKISNSEKFLTEIFKIKIGLSPDLMSDTFEFNEKKYSLQKTYNSGERIQTRRYGL